MCVCVCVWLGGPIGIYLCRSVSKQSSNSMIFLPISSNYHIISSHITSNQITCVCIYIYMLYTYMKYEYDRTSIKLQIDFILQPKEPSKATDVKLFC